MKEVETPVELSVSPVKIEKAQGHNMGKILDEIHKEEQENKPNNTNNEPEKSRYRLVKKKPERKRDNLNNSVYSNDASIFLFGEIRKINFMIRLL